MNAANALPGAVASHPHQYRHTGTTVPHPSHLIISGITKTIVHISILLPVLPCYCNIATGSYQLPVSIHVCIHVFNNQHMIGVHESQVVGIGNLFGWNNHLNEVITHAAHSLIIHQHQGHQSWQSWLPRDWSILHNILRDYPSSGVRGIPNCRFSRRYGFQPGVPGRLIGWFPCIDCAIQ